MTIWRDGALMAAQGAVGADDRGLLLGDGVFDTQQAQDGRPLFFDRHMDRLFAAARIMHIPIGYDAARLYEACREVLKANDLGEGRASLRITITRGADGRGVSPPAETRPMVLVQAQPTTPPATPAQLAFAQTRRNEGSPASRLKTLSYLDNVMARQEAQAVGADEAIMLNNAGRPTCASVANIIALNGETAVTPPLSEGVLDGIVRQVLLETAPRHGLRVQEATLTIDAVAEAEALALTNSLIGVRPVAGLMAPRARFDPEHTGIAALQRAYGQAVAKALASAWG